MKLHFRKLDLASVADIEAAFPVMLQLRSHLNLNSFKQLLEQMRLEKYELWAAFENNKIIGLASSRVYTDLVRGPHIYIDDLVTDQNLRSKGIGAQLLEKIEDDAKSKGINTLRLSCVIENELGLKFYRRLGWQERAFALVKKV